MVLEWAQPKMVGRIRGAVFVFVFVLKPIGDIAHKAGVGAAVALITKA